MKHDHQMDLTRPLFPCLNICLHRLALLRVSHRDHALCSSQPEATVRSIRKFFVIPFLGPRSWFHTANSILYRLYMFFMLLLSSLIVSCMPGWWFQPLWKIWKILVDGMIIPNIYICVYIYMEKMFQTTNQMQHRVSLSHAFQPFEARALVA